jgi:hypothetical protein
MSQLKETKEVAVAVGKLTASTIVSFADGKFNLLTDGANYFDDIPAIFAAISGAEKIPGELPYLTKDGRAEVKDVIVNQILSDVGVTFEDKELLFAIADIAVAALAVAYLVSLRNKPEAAE